MSQTWTRDYGNSQQRVFGVGSDAVRGCLIIVDVERAQSLENLILLVALVARAGRSL